MNADDEKMLTALDRLSDTLGATIERINRREAGTAATPEPGKPTRSAQARAGGPETVDWDKVGSRIRNVATRVLEALLGRAAPVGGTAGSGIGGGSSHAGPQSVVRARPRTRFGRFVQRVRGSRAGRATAKAGGWIGGSMAGRAVGSAVGALGGPIGAAVGGLLGGAIGGAAGSRAAGGPLAATGRGGAVGGVAGVLVGGALGGPLGAIGGGLAGGALGGAAGGAVRALADFKRETEESTKRLMELNKSYAEHCGQMYAVLVDERIKEMNRNRYMGDRLAPSGRALMESEQRRKESQKEIDILFTRLDNNISAFKNDVISTFLDPLNRIAGGVNELVDGQNQQSIGTLSEAISDPKGEMAMKEMEAQERMKELQGELQQKQFR